MKTVYLFGFALIVACLGCVAGSTNVDNSAETWNDARTNMENSAETRGHDWELVCTVPNSFTYKGQSYVMEYVLISPAKVRDITNYDAAAEAIAGTKSYAMISFWTNLSQVPTSAWIPVTNFETMTAEYDRFADDKPPYLHLASWLYPSEEAAIRAHAFFPP